MSNTLKFSNGNHLRILKSMRVFKIPDGQGGISYQVQTPDGVWHITDEKGNFLPDQPAEEPHLPVEASAEESPARPALSRRRGKEKGVEDGSVHFSMSVPKDQHRIINSYILWQRLCTGKGSMIELFLSAVMDHIRKDKEFKAFRERNGLS